MAPTQNVHFNLWRGGDCPVDHETKVDVVLRSGQTVTAARAGSLKWDHEQIGSDVTHFRRTPEPAPVGAEYVRAMEDIKRLIRNRPDLTAHVELGLIKDINSLANAK